MGFRLGTARIACLDDAAYVAPSYDEGADGGLFVNGFLMVGTFDSVGTQVDDWRPKRPITSRAVCSFGGEPAVPAQGGVVRRTADGRERTIGPGTMASSLGSAVRILEARLACTDDRACVVMSYDGSPDSVFVYHVDGREGRIVLPTQGIEGIMDCRQKIVEAQPFPTCHPALTKLYPSFDEAGKRRARSTAAPGEPTTTPRAACRRIPSGASAGNRARGCCRRRDKRGIVHELGGSGSGTEAPSGLL